MTKKKAERSITDVVLPIDKLVPYERNARQHSDAQIALLAKSMEHFGFTNPVLIDEKNMILSGHGRVMAAQRVGMALAPCRRLTGLTDEAKRALIIADNELALKATWDSDLLIDELTFLRDAGVLELTGVTEDQMKVLTEGWNPDYEKVDRKLEAETRGKLVITCKLEDTDQVREFIENKFAEADFIDIRIDE
jgi:hypothetical protein